MFSERGHNPDNAGRKGLSQEELQEMLQEKIAAIRTARGADAIEDVLTSLEPGRFEEQPSQFDSGALSRAEATFLHDGLRAFLASPEHAAQTQDRAAQTESAQQSEQERKARDAREAGAVMEAMLAELDKSGIEGNIAAKNPELARKVLEKLLGLTIDKDSRRDDVGRAAEQLLGDLPEGPTY